MQLVSPALMRFFFFHKKANLKHTTVKLAINAILKTPVAAGATIHISVS